MSIDAFDEYTPPGCAAWRGDEVQVAAMVRPDTGCGAVAAPDAADVEEIDRASMALQAEAIAAFAGAASWEGRFKARPIQRLETRISLSELASYGAVAEGLVPIGISGDTLEPVGMRPSGLWVLCGPPGSGRSTCLWTMAAAVRTARPHGPSAYLGVAHSLAATSMTWSMRAFGEEAVAQAAATVGTDIEQGRFTGGLVVVEALDELLGDDAEDELGRLFKMAREAGVCVLVDGAIDKFNYGVPRCWPWLLPGHRAEPDADELEQITGLAVGRIDRARFPPGRAFLWADAGALPHPGGDTDRDPIGKWSPFRFRSGHHTMKTHTNNGPKSPQREESIMSITHGMNVEEVKGLERELRTHAQAIEDIKGKLNAKIDKVAGNDWKGKDASDFKDKVWAEHRKTLDRIVKDLRAAADQAKKNVVKQEEISRSL